MFQDRAEAGRKLAARLPQSVQRDTVVIALPRGGLPVAEVIAETIGAQLDIALVRKVGLPGQKELALAAVTDGETPRISINRDVADSAGYSDEDIWDLAREQLREIDRRRSVYLSGRATVPVAGKSVIVVDDGIATGATMRAALQFLRAQGPRRIVVAVPVAPREVVAEMAQVADEVICLDTPEPFYAVGAHYRHFEQVPDEAVAAILARHPLNGLTGKP